MSICEICDMDLIGCIHGNPPSTPVMPDFVVLGPTIEAQFDGFCEACGGRVRGVEGTADETHPPDRITRTDIGWVEASCVDRASAGPPDTTADLFKDI